ncbi:hypothetical protein BHE74_00015431 [Ensete ventricosum]|nr:hypothetical protein GW17_00009422 [Ensete ventricosum]RWW76476.1 hypothetical protein BHE74_00015431 [Ensete ventricosum]RZR91313.1 hypothetical protein BHM03_00019410 [Ensete ventricosum]
MLAALMNILKACWQPAVGGHVHSGSDVVGRQDGLLWYKDSGQHINGEFSMAVIQANSLLEDQSQIESGPLSLLDSGPYGTFVGVYDGHGGPETSCYVNNHLFQHLKRKCLIWNLGTYDLQLPLTYVVCKLNGFAAEQQSMSAEVIRKAYQATEEGFLSLVTKQWPMKPQIAAVGSCCLVGVVSGGLIYTANLGDSRVVLGKLVKATGKVLAVQLSAEHNAGIESVRQELQSVHPEDKRVVVLKHNVWRVKGLIQYDILTALLLSFAISCNLANLLVFDVWLIRPQFTALLQGIARRLIKAALREAAKKREMRYSDLNKIDRGVRRHFHDDITVIVVFLDAALVSRASSLKGPTLSMRGGGINLPAHSLAPCTTPTGPCAT